MAGNVVLVGQLVGREAPAIAMGCIKWNPTKGADLVSKITAAGVDVGFTGRRQRSVQN
jgi:hypothetical protein